MTDKRDKMIRPCPSAAAGIARLGLVGYLHEQFELWRGTWHEWECGENDEDLCGAWEDGDPEMAAFYAALLDAVEGKVLVDEAALREAFHTLARSPLEEQEVLLRFGLAAPEKPEGSET